MPRLDAILPLAWRDLAHGWQSTACLSVAVMVALIPLLLLYGLRFGVVTSLIDTLRSDPRVLEIKLVDDTELSQDWMDALAADPRTGFLLPRARYLSGKIDLRAPGGRRLVEVRVVPSASGDPLLEGAAHPVGLTSVVLSESVAVKAGLEPGADGATVDLVIRRIVGEKREGVRHNVTVAAILPSRMLATDDILASPDLEGAIERWREGFAVPELGWEGVSPDSGEDAQARSFASFRLYARDVRDVPGLRDRLVGEGFDIETQASEVEQALLIEAGLGVVFLIVSALAAIGFVLTLGLHLAAAVVEKARELALLKMLGLRSFEVAMMPAVQGGIIGLVGALAAVILIVLAQPMLNNGLEGLAGLEGDISRLEPVHLIVAVLGTTLAGMLAGSVAAVEAARLEPTRGLRRD